MGVNAYGANIDPLSSPSLPAWAAAVAAALDGSDTTVNARITAATANGTVTTAKLADGAVTDAKITAGVAQAKVTNLVSDLAAKAPLASPTFTGTVTLPAATVGTATIADGAVTDAKITAGVAQAKVTNLVSDLAAKAPLASPTFTGTVTLPAATITPAMMAGQVSAKTANYTMTAADSVVTASGTMTVTLPDASAAGITGRVYTIRNIAATVVTIARTASQTIDGVTGTVTLPNKGTMSLVSDGANWLVIAGEYSDETVGRRIFRWSSALASGATAGWQLTYGDTGWRDVASSLLTANGFTTVAWLLIRRTTNAVALSFSTLQRTTSGSGNFLTLPVGFYVPQSVYGKTYSNNSWYVSGAACFINMTGTSDVGVGFNVSTETPWPTSLPGAAAGGIPTA